MVQSFLYAYVSEGGVEFLVSQECFNVQYVFYLIVYLGYFPMSESVEVYFLKPEMEKIVMSNYTEGIRPAIEDLARKAVERPLLKWISYLSLGIVTC
jgi:hypothetical protein